MPVSLVYLDYAATTPVRPEVLEAMLPYLGTAAFGNPSSSHRFGRTARAGLEQARREVAQAVGVEPTQVIFTSGGTEADNHAVIGGCLAARARGDAMLAAVSAIEHKAVLAAAHQVKHLGGAEVILPVEANGLLDLDALTEVLLRKPSVVSVMWVNNEIGVVQPVREIAARCKDAGVLLHTDAVQAFGKIPVSFADFPCTLASLSGHKIGAHKGVGALIVREAKVDRERRTVHAPSVYTQMVWEQNNRRVVEGRAPIDWVVMRNRMTHIDARNKRDIASLLEKLAARIGFRLAPGFGERMVYREMFLKGLTLLDIMPSEAGYVESPSHAAARREMTHLLAAVGVPVPA
jgi:selenocysteine lyase/cysteine desulfurase